MSKANSAIKVLRTALKRVQKGWTQGSWMYRDPETGQVFVCMEGGMFGYCHLTESEMTPAQLQARNVVLEVIHDRYDGMYRSIPNFNDSHERTVDEVMEVLKLGIIRLETSDGLDDEEVDDLLEYMEKR